MENYVLCLHRDWYLNFIRHDLLTCVCVCVCVIMIFRYLVLGEVCKYGERA